MLREVSHVPGVLALDSLRPQIAKFLLWSPSHYLAREWVIAALRLLGFTNSAGLATASRNAAPCLSSAGPGWPWYWLVCLGGGGTGGDG